ncbi:hypothetical protein [Dokdonella koreensis]|uniref:Uncharacterized protein n=1 Tax=Dokdonella koreensis DS-123 TaxID=1300342 RepID=A0A160DSE2_9GAMM|nr:hypothetical protein [Dokdonella koreensis]ANB16800.1 Hypothetical protein I596_764 [Dokdonella koreensis DS-123]
MVGVEFGGKQYVALEFTPNRTGSFWLTGSSTAFQHYGGGGNGISASISKRCGDFTSTPGPTSPTPTGCWFNNLGPSGHISYSIVTGNYECKLQLGETYYLNMVYTPLPITSESRSECAAGGCRMQYQNNCPGSVDCGSVSP